MGDITRLPFFLDRDHTVRGIQRHAVNPRQHAGVKAQYVASVRMRGIIESVRGECWCVEAVPDSAGVRSGPKGALTFGSLTEAFYEALSQDPTNGALLATLTKGLAARVLNYRTPPAVLRYLVRFHNGFHGGAGTSFVELISAVPEASRTQLEKRLQQPYILLCDESTFLLTIVESCAPK